jgi:hypothetical protein
MLDAMKSRSPDQSKSARKAMTIAELERALTDAVKASHPECEAFGAVFVERIAPPWPDAANWALKGVKFGKADRERCGGVLSDLVAERQLEFDVSE